jgi:transcriptional regulator with XRE-family HTH domain
MAADILVRVGRRIRVLRTKREWTQTMLADHAQITREHLSELENGKKEAGIRTIQQIASALDISLAEFFARL